MTTTSTKIITLLIPCEKNLNDNNFSPEENFLMLKIGGECLIEARKAVAALTQREMYNKLKEETKEEVKKLEIDNLVQKELSKQMEINMKSMYENHLEKTKETLEFEKTQLLKTISMLNEKVKQFEEDSGSFLNIKLESEREKWKDKERQLDLKIEDYEKKGEKMRVTCESIMVNSNKSNSAKGSEGEKQFEEYAVYTFKDFTGFEIIDKHTKGGEGDFHLHFEEFNILADAKNYKSNIPSTQREKIKKDLLKNEHIQFGWLVSLHSSIDKYDRSPIMYEWINTKQCLVYINNLCSFEDPSKVLRIIWFTCKELNKFAEMNNECDDEELTDLKQHKFMMLDKIKALRKTIKEANTSMNTLKNIVQSVDEQLREMLGAETNELVDSSSSLFDDWWESNIEITEDVSAIESVTEIWYKFRQENKDIIKQFDITMDKFKQFVKTKMPVSCLVTKTKTINSTFSIKGIKIKKEKILNNLLPLSNNNVKKANKVGGDDNEIVFYIDEITDKNIVKDYIDINNDIFSISKSRNLEIYQVLSVLVRNKVILKRNEARGYLAYTETDAYKKKKISSSSKSS